MTNWGKEVDRTTARRLWNSDQLALVVWDKGVDWQKTDTVAFNGEGKFLGPQLWEVTHVIKNQNGIENGYAILCLKHPDSDYYRNRAKELAEENERLTRSNAALRGAITKLRKRVMA